MPATAGVQGPAATTTASARRTVPSSVVAVPASASTAVTRVPGSTSMPW